jgi:PAS domain S-box-containing protein
MMRDWGLQSGRIAAQLLIGGVGLPLLTFACFRLGLALAPTGVIFFLLVTLLSLIGTVIGSVVLSVIAVGLLNYYFTEPLFAFRVDYPQDILALIAFLTTSIIVATLMARSRQVAERLRESEAQWREVFEHNPVMYFMVDTIGTVLSVNNFGAAQLGYTVRELVGKSVLNVFFEEDREFVQKNIAVCLETLGHSNCWEIRKVRKDGTVLWVRENAKAVRRSNNRLIVMVACEDITESKRTEDSLRLSEAYMAHAQQLVSIGSWAYSNSELNGYWTKGEHWSAELWRITGFDPAAGFPPTEEIFSRIHPDDRQRMVEANNQVIKTGKPLDIQYRFYRGDGELRVLHSIGTLIGESGVATRFVGATRDITEQHRNQDALRLSELYMAYAQQLTGVGSWAYTPSGQCEHWSAEMFRMFGVDPAKGYPTIEEGILLVHPEDRQRTEEAATQLYKDGRALDTRYRIIRPDGQQRIIRDIGAPTYENEIITRFVGACLDITEQERTTENLRRSEFYLSEGQRLTRTGSWSFTPDGRFNYWSAEAYVNFGFDPSKGVPTIAEMLTVVHPEDRALINKTAETMIGEGVGCDFKYRIIHPERGVRIMHSIGNATFENRKATLFIGTTLDITEQELLTQELQRREAYLAEAQRLSHTGSFGWSITTGEINWSDETFRIFDYDRAIKPTIELVIQRTHPEDRAVVERFLAHASDDKKDWDVEHRLLMPNGSVKYVRAVAHAAKGASRELEFIGAVMDVTATRHANDELHQARAQLAHVTRVTTLGELTASIAHEVNQPLSGIVSSGNASLRWLANHPPNIDSAIHSIDRIIRDANRASEVVGRVRGLAKRAPLQKAWVNVNETVQETLALTRTEIEKNVVALKSQLSDDVPLIFSDRIQLQQVILNLIINAIEAIGATSDGPRDLLVRTAKDKSGGVIVAVSDSGAGMDPSTLENIFAAFYTTKREGMGMGLAVSRSIIESQGGRLWATQNKPRGAIFQFTLPPGHEDAP